jgi:hypothetical protein
MERLSEGELGGTLAPQPGDRGVDVGARHFPLVVEIGDDPKYSAVKPMV